MHKQRIHIYVRGKFTQQVPSAVGPEGDDIMDLADIGIIYNDASRGADNDAAFAAYMTERSGKGVSLRVSGPQSVAHNDKREPATAWFDSTLNVLVGGVNQPASFALYSEGAVINNQVITGVTPIISVTRAAGTTPFISLRDIKFISTGVGIEFITAGSTTFCSGCEVEYSGTGTFTFDDFTDLLTAPYAIRVKDADGLFIDGFVCSVASGHGVLVDRWNAGRFDGNVREAAGVGFKGQNLSTVIMEGRLESNKGWGVYIKDSGINDRQLGGNVAQDGSPSAMQFWTENNNSRDSIYAQPSGGYQYTQQKYENVARLVVAGHTGWESNMWRIDEASRQSIKSIEALRIDISDTPDFELVTGGTVDSGITLPSAGFGNLSVTNWDVIWTSAPDRPTVSLIGTPGTDEHIRITWPSGSFDSTTVQDSAYWRPWGLIPLTSPGTFIYEVEYNDVTNAGPLWCISREDATERQTPRLGTFHIAPVAGGQVFAPSWNSKRRKLLGRIHISEARSDVSPGMDAYFDGMEFKTGGAAQVSSIVYDIHQWRMWRITG